MKEVNPYYYLAAGVTFILLVIGMAIGCYFCGKRKGYVEMEDEMFNDLEMKGHVND